jgi:N-acetylglucosamine-6-sulfatase
MTGSRTTALALVAVGTLLTGSQLPLQRSAPSSRPELARIAGARPRNIIFILTDDHRYDAMGFMGRSFVETPNLDYLARNGVHIQNAFVTTALCSPSRASILTGQYAHRHRVIDNNNAVPPGTTFFSQYLQSAGYDTAFVGKWHMGRDSDDPQPGFGHWVSFRGQGTYLPNPNGLNVNGTRVPQKGYITDELTDYALDWLKARTDRAPFFLYLSHKGVHSDFVPAERHKNRYATRRFTPPETMAPAVGAGLPMWVQNQRNSHHGVEFPYHGNLDLEEYYRRYLETLLSVDDSVGRIIGFLRERRLLDSTLLVYMGDNGFAFGEHGLIDKRTAYDESMRVPMLAHCPELFHGQSTLTRIVANIDIAPTMLEAAGLQAPSSMDGRSFLALAQGRAAPWRSSLLYEYYWERNYPQTPTMHALRGDRYKYIRYYGLWDTDELYDIVNDPLETKNLITDTGSAPMVQTMNQELFKVLDETGGMYLPLNADRGMQFNLRRAGASRAADFPAHLQR